MCRSLTNKELKLLLNYLWKPAGTAWPSGMVQCDNPNLRPHTLMLNVYSLGGRDQYWNILILDCPYRASTCLPNHSMYPGNFYCSGIICTFTKEESPNIKMLKRTFRKSMLLLRDCYLILILYGCIYGVTTNNRFITAVII